MRSRPKKIIITTDEYVILQAREHAGEVIDWFAECEFRDKIMREHQGQNLSNREYEFELRMEYPESKLKYDPITKELRIYRNDHWVEYKIAIRYCFEGKIFDKIIQCQWNRPGIPKDCKLDVCFYDNNPEELQWIREHHDPFKRSIIEMIQQRLFSDEYKVYSSDNYENQEF